MKKNSHDYARVLYHILIIHTQKDMGGLGKKVRNSTIRELGQQVWHRKQLAVDRMWDSIEQFIDNLRLSFTGVRLYQDGLPVCGREADIVRDLSLQGSRNHRLLLRLMEKGCALMGTESPELLVQEYKLAWLVMTGETKASGIDHQELLRSRDRFIANRINGTLRTGETGVLFLGMLHTLEGLLDDDIRVISVPPYPVAEEKNE